MSLKVTVNFDDTYPPIIIEPDFTEMSFISPQKTGTDVELFACIKPHPDQELPNVFNLGFGPPDGNGGFKDNVKLSHSNNDKVFSTVLFLALLFLEKNPHLTIGLDGSDDSRATLYHLMFKSNKEYLNDFFIPIGVDWYVRIFRDNTYEQDEEGHYIKRPRPEPFNYERTRHDLYRYYMFRLK
ncbi:MAG: hypothetical protein EOO88_06125 [Pedobacter sp.]|nr:MAG: hypothetical protein EOO88_06125 [Pedobacter sp.]